MSYNFCLKMGFFLCILIVWMQHPAESQTPKRGQAVYFNLGGSAPLVAVNYDRRIHKKNNGAGFSIGGGYYGGLSTPVISIPVSINYLAGHRYHFAEVATGATWISERGDFWDDGKQNGGVLWHATAGYRFQHKKGLIARIGAGPLFAKDYYSFWLYLGVGVAF